MKDIIFVLAVAVLVEAMVEYFKSIVKMFADGERKTAIMQLITIAVGVLFAYLFKLHLFEVLEMPVNSTADMILTGIIISRGSNYVNDLISRIRGEHAKVEEVKKEAEFVEKG